MDKNTIRANVPPAQTWNYLKINNQPLPSFDHAHTGQVFEAVPHIFNTIETGAGDDATRWIAERAGDARFIEIPKFQDKTEPVIVDALAAPAQNTAVILREGSKAVICLYALTKKDEEQNSDEFSSALTRIIVEEGAKLTLIEIIALSDTGSHLENVGIKAAKNAKVSVKQYALGGQKILLGCAVDLTGTKSTLDLSLRYHVDKNSLLDVNHVCRQRGKKTHSEMHSGGVLADSAQKTLRETIDLIHGAKAAKGNESETVLLIGDNVVNKTLPVILCDEEDVQGNHGATIGSLSQDQLYYLAAHGLAPSTVEDLFVRAIFDDALIHAPADNIREDIRFCAKHSIGEEAAKDLIADIESSLVHADTQNSSSTPLSDLDTVKESAAH